MSIQSSAAAEPSASYIASASAPVLDRMALLTKAPDGVQRLRRLIIAMAVSGKLVRESADSSSPWPIVAISDLRPDFQNGASSRGDEGGDPTVVVRLADVIRGEISLHQPRKLPIRQADKLKHGLRAGDILVIRVNGSADLVGRFVVCRGDLDAIPCDHFIRMRCDLKIVLPDYLRLVGDSLAVRSRIGAMFVSTAGQKTINQGHLSSITFALPPLAEQHRIVARVEELMKLCDALEANGRLADEQHERLTSTLFEALATSESAHALAENWQRVAECFDLLLDRPEAIAALESTVRTLAARGLLVLQNAGDGTADELRSKIDSEHAELQRQGLAKPRKTVTEVQTLEQPFSVPTNWAWVRFDELVRADKPIAYGVLVPGPDAAEGVPFVRLADLSLCDPSEYPAKRIAPEVDAQFARTRLDGGEILLGVVGSIGKLGGNNKPREPDAVNKPKENCCG